MTFTRLADSLFSSNKRELYVWSGLFYLFSNVAFIVLVSRYLEFVFPFETNLAKIYAPVTLIGQTFLFFVAFYLVTAALILLTGSNKLVKGAAVLASSTFIIYLIVDFAVYSQYRFHLNKIVIDLLVGGGKEIFDFSTSTLLYIGQIILSALILQLFTAWISWKVVLWSKPVKRYIFIPYITVSLICLTTFNAINAWADVNFERSVTRFTRHIPLFYPLTAKGFFQDYGLADASDIRNSHEYIIRKNIKGQVKYPASPLSFSENGSDMNLLIIVLDSFRFDMLTDRITPHIYTFTKEHNTLNFKKHFSGGNSTRNGIFSLFYGLPGTYWNLMYEEQVGPLLMSEVLRRNYQTGIFASATLTRPPFDRTVFTDIPNLRSETDGNNVWERDEIAVSDWLEWIEKADKSKPFFGFIFLDSAHGYVFPPDYSADFGEIFEKGMLEKIDYHKLNNDTDPAPFRNRYKTSVHYADSLVGKVLDDLKAKDLTQRTVIVITGDHGQEFNENKQNFWGHGSNFTKYQTQVPLVISWPGKKEQTYTHLSTHFDVSATLIIDPLAVLTKIPPFTSGQSLFNVSNRDWFVSGGFSKTAIVEQDRITVSYETGTYEIFDKTNKELKSAKLRPEILEKVFKELSKFN